MAAIINPRKVPIKINEKETEQLKASAATLRSVIDKLDL